MTFIEFLQSNHGKAIYVDYCTGNNGDRLISLGMGEAIATAQSEIVATPTEADLIIINGGGMFIDPYEQGIKKLKNYTQFHPEKTLCVAPNSYHFHNVDFGKLLSLRTGPLYLFSREHYSKRYIDRLARCHEHVISHIDNDLAFQLKDSEVLKKIKKQYAGPIAGNILIVDRMDVENPRTSHPPRALKQAYLKFCPTTIRTSLKSIRLAKRNRFGSRLTANAIKIITEKTNPPPIRHLDTIDISRTDVCSFDQFIKTIAEAEYIFTNRLHVGILGYMLGRNVYLEEGSYHKILGIYEYSMAAASCVTMMTTPSDAR